MTTEVSQKLTWQDVREIVELADSLLGRKTAEELMGQYPTAEDFYKSVREKLAGR